MRGPLVIFVFSILLDSGLTFPMNRIKQRQAKDLTASAAPESNSSTVTVIEASEPNVQKKSVPNVKRTDPLGERVMNKVNERSLVKIIKKSKWPRYRLHDSILDNDLFSVAGQDDNNNTISFHEIFNSVKASSLKLSNNMTTKANKLKVENNKNELINTYLPLKSIGNGSEIEIVKNTVLHHHPPSPYAPSHNKSTKNINVKWDHHSLASRNLKHQVRKYFRLHSSIEKELEARAMPRPKPDYSRSSNSEGTAAPALKIDYGAYGQTHRAPQKQSIVLRWNLILI